jgi:hypothetical protein
VAMGRGQIRNAGSGTSAAGSKYPMDGEKTKCLYSEPQTLRNRDRLFKITIPLKL